MTSIYEMKIRTELASGKVKIQRTTCYGDDGVAQERAHYRSLAPAGSSQTITVTALKG
jgi:hypothetical protein